MDLQASAVLLASCGQAVIWIKEIRIAVIVNSMERKPYLYQHYTWPEIREVVKSQPW
jgi:hypothetical protein